MRHVSADRYQATAHNADSQFFGEDEDATGELDDAEKQGENGMSRSNCNVGLTKRV